MVVKRDAKRWSRADGQDPIFQVEQYGAARRSKLILIYIESSCSRASPVEFWNQGRKQSVFCELEVPKRLEVDWNYSGTNANGSFGSSSNLVPCQLELVIN